MTEQKHDPVFRTIDMSACIEWPKFRDKWGYGVARYKNKTQRAHRVAWEKKNGEIPEGLCVLHRCDNRACVNTDHLFLGTNLDNVKDMDAKGRSRRVKGREHGMSRISEQTAIRLKMVKGLVQAKVVAPLVGLKKSQVCNIMNGVSWRTVTPNTRYSF